MNAKQVLKKLESLGTPQTRKTYGRHGVTGAMYGVKYGDLYKLVKELGPDHDLALALWSSGNHDARVLATMIVEPERLTAKDLKTWVAAIDNHVLSHAVAGAASRSPAGLELMRSWMGSKREWPAATGWMMLGTVVQALGSVTSDECKELLSDIEARIHTSANRVKYSMNTAMIAIGSYVPGLEDHAVAVAERIGQVEVDHGLTDCKTPLAGPYIRKAAAHHRARLQKAAAKAKPKKRPAKRGASSGRRTAG